mmetsp:Transcript_26871/g.56038  ORF Transcript_26871/g.56038 Transcript_26871/m.56038 type:complete len:216 (+) Transcript_26871:29-676(+)
MAIAVYLSPPASLTYFAFLFSLSFFTLFISISRSAKCFIFCAFSAITPFFLPLLEDAGVVPSSSSYSSTYSSSAFSVSSSPSVTMYACLRLSHSINVSNCSIMLSHVVSSASSTSTDSAFSQSSSSVVSPAAVGGDEAMDFNTSNLSISRPVWSNISIPLLDPKLIMPPLRACTVLISLRGMHFLRMPLMTGGDATNCGPDPASTTESIAPSTGS